MSPEAEQNRRSVNKEVDKIFNNSDYKRFKWAFLKYMCEVNRPVTDYELFLTSNLGGYMGDENQMKKYVLEHKENIYNVAINRVMQCLIDRNFVTSRIEKIGESEMISYLATPYLQEKCNVFKKYMMGDIDRDLNLPVDIVTDVQISRKEEGISYQ
ncbi:MAG: hypothetical protein ACJ718_08500 [Nitrososphaeraceae archaeon]